MLATSQVPYQTKGKLKKLVLTVTVDAEVLEALKLKAVEEERSISNMANTILRKNLL